MSDVRHDEHTDLGPNYDVRALVRRLGDATTPPAPFDVAAALLGGRRHAARRRVCVSAGVAVLALAVSAVVAVPGLLNRLGDSDGADRLPARPTRAPPVRSRRRPVTRGTPCRRCWPRPTSRSSTCGRPTHSTPRPCFAARTTSATCSASSLGCSAE